MSAPDIDAQFQRLSETAHRIADERNSFLSALRQALPAMKLFYSFYGDDEHVSGVAEAVAFRKVMSVVETAIAKAEQ